MIPLRFVLLLALLVPHSSFAQSGGDRVCRPSRGLFPVYYSNGTVLLSGTGGGGIYVSGKHVISLACFRQRHAQRVAYYPLFPWEGTFLWEPVRHICFSANSTARPVVGRPK